MTVTVPYPKWITTPEGKRLIVQNAAEEEREMTPALDPQRVQLVSEAEKLGVKVDGRWSDGRLASEIKTAQDKAAPKTEVKADDHGA